MTRTTTLTRTLTTVGLVTVALTLLAGFVGAVLRFTMWGAVGGHPMYGGPMHGGGMSAYGPGFEMGFGVPLTGVLVWAVLLATVATVAYLVYQSASETEISA